MDELFLDQWRINAIHNTLRTFKVSIFISARVSDLPGLALFFSCLLTESCGDTAAKNHNRTDRNMYKNNCYILPI